MTLEIDSLAQEIRRVDENHTLGAAALAEALMPFIKRASSSQEQAPADKDAPWQPIETAPKMTKLLVGYVNKCGKWRTVMARYYVDNSLQVDDDSIGDEEGYAPEGWYEESESHCEHLLPIDEPPTLWMWLPAQPSFLQSQSQQVEE